MSNTLNLGTDGNWATKEDSLLAYNSENGNFKPLPFDFTRASSATVVNKAGLIETVGSGEPRIDFSNDAKGALLLEPTRSNLVAYSEDFTQWIGASYITSNYAISPDGTLNASRLLFTGAGQEIKYSLTTSSSTSGSIYVKGISGKTIRFGLAGSENNFTLNGNWQKLEIQGTETSNKITLNTYGSVTARDLSIYGAQLEVGSYATSYIPTQGSAVTRVADSSSQTVPSGIIGQTEGTMFLDFIYNHSNTSISESLSLSDGSSSNRLYIGNVFANTLSCVIIANSVVQFSAFTSYNLVIGQRYKAALCYKLNNFSFYVNGVEIATDTSGSVPLMNRIGFDSGSGTSNFYKPTNQVKLYNTRLSNSELQALTK